MEEQVKAGEIDVFDDVYLLPGKRPSSAWVRAMCSLELRISRSFAQGRQQSANERKAELNGIRVYWRIRKKHAVEMEQMLQAVKADCRVVIPGGWIQ